MPWVLVQSIEDTTHFGAANQAAFSKAFASPVAVGDTILIVSTEGGDVTTLAPTLTDQLGNTYTRVTTAQGGRKYDSAHTQGIDLWWCIVTVAGTPTVTYTPGAITSGWLSIRGRHWTGSDATSTLRSSAGVLATNPGVSANAITTGSIAAQSGDLVWAGGGNVGTNTVTEVAGTGFTAPSAGNATTGLYDEWNTATGAEAATFTDATNGALVTFVFIGVAISPVPTIVSLQYDKDQPPVQQRMAA